jgi:CubicO group peptidase (beta-lactamase class C family)
MTPERLPETQALIRAHVADGLVSGIVVAWQQEGGAVRFDCVGAPAFASGTALGRDSLFRLYSQTKPVTGIAAMMLVEQGLLHLDQPVREILPAFGDMRVSDAAAADGTRPAARPITIRHLLTHTAGFGYHNAGDAMAALYLKHGLSPGTRDRVPGPGERPTADTLDEFGRLLATLPLARDPGTAFEYSLSIDLLGLVVQTVSGLPFEVFLERHIFAPLGMPDTGFVVHPGKLDRLTALAEKRNDGWKLVDDPRYSVYARPALPSGGGGLVSSPADYARFAGMLANGGELDGVRLLRAETVALAGSNLLPPAVDHIELPLGYPWPGVGFGAAMQVQLTGAAVPKGVFGWMGAAGTAVWLDPERRFFFLFMTQYWPSEINPMLRPELIAAVYRDLAA